MRGCWAYLKDLISFANLLHMHVLLKKNNQGVRITLVYCEVGAFLNLNLLNRTISMYNLTKAEKLIPMGYMYVQSDYPTSPYARRLLGEGGVCGFNSAGMK